VILSNGLIDADVFELSKAVVLVNLDECERAGKLVGTPEVFDEEVSDGDGFCSSCDSDAPLSGLEEFLGGRRLVGVEDAPSDDFAYPFPNLNWTNIWGCGCCVDWWSLGGVGGLGGCWLTLKQGWFCRFEVTVAVRVMV
jgi:hypothetical protein